MEGEMQNAMDLIAAARARRAVSADPDDLYARHVDQPYGAAYAAAVARFQEGFLRDRVCRDLDSAFARAVETAERLLPAIMAKAGV